MTKPQESAVKRLLLIKGTKEGLGIKKKGRRRESTGSCKQKAEKSRELRMRKE